MGSEMCIRDRACLKSLNSNTFLIAFPSVASLQPVKFSRASCRWAELNNSGMIEDYPVFCLIDWITLRGNRIYGNPELKS